MLCSLCSHFLEKPHRQCHRAENRPSPLRSFLSPARPVRNLRRARACSWKERKRKAVFRISSKPLSSMVPTPMPTCCWVRPTPISTNGRRLKRALKKPLSWMTNWLLLISLSARASRRSEEHTSELQSLRHLVCRLLLEKKKKKIQEKTRIRHS